MLLSVESWMEIVNLSPNNYLNNNSWLKMLGLRRNATIDKSAIIIMNVVTLWKWTAPVQRKMYYFPAPVVLLVEN